MNIDILGIDIAKKVFQLREIYPLLVSLRLYPRDVQLPPE
ncbi:hypothetical protein ABID44_003717 [Aquamicrobium ahrensii]|uniref:Transposase n=1 Tax=Aquamicrobium ahrensii TaxID=469551 RepID=A0ABV2KQL7_9HYPH